LDPDFRAGAEVEEKIILASVMEIEMGSHLTHATEWTDNLHTTEGEFEAGFGSPGIWEALVGSVWSCGIITSFRLSKMGE